MTSMLRLMAVSGALLLSAAWAETPPSSRPPPTPTTEPSRLAGEYFVQRAGAAWSYQAGKGKARWVINTFVDWRAGFSFSYGKRSGNGVWLVRDGVWLEKNPTRGEGELVVLPAVMTVGTRWSAPSSIERGGKDASSYEVMALDASVELPTGVSVDYCLAVLETGVSGGAPITHYYAPNVGKVAVRGADDWLLRLAVFTSGSKGHGD